MAEDKVLKATSKDLAAPDWSINIDLCDYVNQRGESGAGEVTELLKHRLNNKNKKICYLGLILSESLMKNCGPALHHAFCEKTFLDFVANLGRGKKGEENQKKALQLIQSWAFSFRKQKSEYPLFQKLYGAMKSVEDIEFDADKDVEVFEPLTDIPATNVPSKSAVNFGEGPFDKLERELTEVQYHCDRYEKLLRKYFNDELDDEDKLLDEEDYLLQCKPRIQELIEAGSVGLFPDNVYEHCFTAFDNTNRVLDIKENGFPDSDDEDRKTKKKGKKVESNNKKKVVEKKVPKKKKVVEKEEEDDDDDDGSSSEEEILSDDSDEKAKKSKDIDDDDIDIFFNQRANDKTTIESEKKKKKDSEDKKEPDDAMAILDEILNS